MKRLEKSHRKYKGNQALHLNACQPQQRSACFHTRFWTFPQRHSPTSICFPLVHELPDGTSVSGHICGSLQNNVLICRRHPVPSCVCSVAQSCATLWPHGLQPTRILCIRNFQASNTRVGCYFLLQGIFLTQGSNPRLLHLLHWQENSVLPGKPRRCLIRGNA